MRDTLRDIREKLNSSAYKNEEHVRLSLIARVLLKLGWNIWDPNEVNTEFSPVPNEDSTRVDIALFSTPRKAGAFIEVKPVGKISSGLQDAEQQLRNYNRDNTALFSILSDGQIWRFYLSQTAGRFSEKCFKELNLLESDLDDVEHCFNIFLQKSEMCNGNAEREAKNYLTLTEKQRVVERLLPQARKAIQEPPYPSLPEILVDLVSKEDFTITVEDAKKFIAKMKGKTTTPPGPNISTGSPETKPPHPIVGTFNPENPPDLRHTSVIEASFGNKSANNWNALVRSGVKTAIEGGTLLNKLHSLSVPVKEGSLNTRGFHPLKGTNISVQNVDAGKAWHFALVLAKELNVEVKVRFMWRDNIDAAHPGKEGSFHWAP